MKENKLGHLLDAASLMLKKTNSKQFKSQDSCYMTEGKNHQI